MQYWSGIGSGSQALPASAPKARETSLASERRGTGQSTTESTRTQHMNPSRDIEKLFDKFGGDAGNYQEIGRENEAIHARTRWPLLATLDLSQPSIPNIAPRRDALLPQTHDRSGEHRSVPNSLTQPPGAAPLNRGKPPLFARAHRKTVPPVANVKLPDAPVGAARFSALADVVEERSNAEEAAAVQVVAAQPQPPLQPLSQTSLRPQQAQ